MSIWLAALISLAGIVMLAIALRVSHWLMPLR